MYNESVKRESQINIFFYSKRLRAHNTRALARPWVVALLVVPKGHRYQSIFGSYNEVIVIKKKIRQSLSLRHYDCQCFATKHLVRKQLFNKFTVVN